MRDVRLFHSDDGGELDIDNGRIALDDTLETAAYVSLFGANRLDDGTDATADKQWWGNSEEPVQHRKLRSETQYLLDSLPQTTGNLARIVEAAHRDLAWMEDEVGAKVEVTGRIPGLDRITLEVSIAVDGRTAQFRFTERWGSP